MTFIGAVRGDVNGYFRLLEELNPTTSIQLGDFGGKRSYDSFIDYPVDVVRHQIMMGDEDFYPYIYHAFSLGDYGIFDLEEHTLGFVRGCATPHPHLKHPQDSRHWGDPEQHLRGWEDYDNIYFPKEEQVGDLGYKRMIEALTYRTPNVFFSHDCPQSVSEKFFGGVEPSRTKDGLELILNAYQPKLWVFAHQSLSKRFTHRGVDFVSLATLETFTI